MLARTSNAGLLSAPGGTATRHRRDGAWFAAARRWAITLACLLAGAGIAATAERFLPTAADCAARDVTPRQLATAAAIMNQAQRSCSPHDGHIPSPRETAGRVGEPQ